jgi:hypothetical protein
MKMLPAPDKKDLQLSREEQIRLRAYELFSRRKRRSLVASQRKGGLECPPTFSPGNQPTVSPAKIGCAATKPFDWPSRSATADAPRSSGTPLSTAKFVRIAPRWAIRSCGKTDACAGNTFVLANYYVQAYIGQVSKHGGHICGPLKGRIHSE